MVNFKEKMEQNEKKEKEDLKIVENITTFFAGKSVDSKDIDNESENIVDRLLAEIPASDLENLDAVKVDLEKNQKFLGVFKGFKIQTDKRKKEGQEIPKQFIVVNLKNIKNKDIIMTFNIIMKRVFENLKENDPVIIICTGEGSTTEGVYKTYKAMGIRKQSWNLLLEREGLKLGMAEDEEMPF